MGAQESKQDTPELEHIFKEIDTAGDGFITAQCLSLLNWGCWYYCAKKREWSRKSFNRKRYSILFFWIFVLTLFLQTRLWFACEISLKKGSSSPQIFWALCTFRELKKALLKLGQKLEDTEIHDLIKICDSNGDNKIDFQEFVDMMTLR